MDDTFAVRGFFRVQITDDGKVVGDSGWRKNTITNLGINQYLVSTLGAIAGSKTISHVALGTGGTIATNATALTGEVDETNARAAVTAATNGSTSLQLTATFSSSQITATDGYAISNIGLFNTSTVTTGTVFAGNTYASSTWATNQNVNITYNVNFARA